MLIGGILAARCLGADGYGALGVVNSTLGMLGVLAGLGLGTTVTKYLADLRQSDPARAGSVLGLAYAASLALATLVTAGTLAAAPALAEQVLAAPALARTLQIGTVLLFFNSLIGVQSGALAGLEAFRTAASLNIACGAFSATLTLLGAWLHGVAGAVAGAGLAAGMSCVMMEVAVVRECRRFGIRRSFTSLAAEADILWRFALPACLAAAMVAPVTWLANAMLVNQPDGYREMGLFNAANQWRMALLLLPSVLGAVTIPILSSVLAQGDRRAARKVLFAAMGGTAIVTLPIAGMLGIWGDEVLSLYGQEFSGQGTLLWLIALTAGLLAILTPVGHFITASGRMWLGLMMNLGWAVVVLISAWWLLGNGFGSRGLAGAYLLGYIAHTIWTVSYARSQLLSSRRYG
jgi:O-antigen/teichoic acid export membrane protein